jgi:hypothetical protein
MRRVAGGRPAPSLIVIAGLVGVLVFAVADGGSAAVTACKSVPVSAPIGRALTIPVKAPTSQDEVLPMGRERGPETVSVDLHVSRALPAGVRQLNVYVSPFRRLDGHRLEKDMLAGSATVNQQGTRKRITLELCFDPDLGGVHAQAGEYIGSVQLDDRRVGDGQGNFRIQLQFTPLWLVLLVGTVGGAAGLVGAVFTATGLSFRRAYLSKHIIRMVVSFALAAGATAGIMMAQYFRDPSWMGSANLFVTYFIACVGAAYAAGNAAGTFGVKTAAPETPDK